MSSGSSPFSRLDTVPVTGSTQDDLRGVLTGPEALTMNDFARVYEEETGRVGRTARLPARAGVRMCGPEALG